MIIVFEFPYHPTIAPVEKERQTVPRVGETVFHNGEGFTVEHVVHSTSDLIVRVILV